MNSKRARFVQLLARPDDLFLSAADLGRSLGLAVLLVALLGFPARLFNQTAKANRHRLSEWLARLTAPFAWLRLGRAGVLMSFAGTSVLVGAVVHWFLDPGFPGRDGSGEFALGMVLGFALIVANVIFNWRRTMREAGPDAGVDWHVYPGQILVSLVCVTVSRMAHFVPGLIFGLAGDLELRKPVALEHLGRAVMRTATCLLAISLSAWVLSIPVGRAAADGGFALRTLDAMLAVIAVAGMEWLLFMLAPFAFLDGYDLFRWRPAVWAAIWGTSVAWFCIVVLNPALSHYQGEAHASFGWIVGLLVFEAVVAFGLWAFFVAHNRARQRATTG